MEYNATYDISNFIVQDFIFRSNAIGGTIVLEDENINLVSKGELCVVVKEVTKKEAKFDAKTAAMLVIGLIALFAIIAYMGYRSYIYFKEEKFDPLIYIPWKQNEFRKIKPLIPTDRKDIILILDRLDVLPTKSRDSKSEAAPEPKYTEKSLWIELAKCYLIFYYREYYDFDYNYVKYDLAYDYDTEVLKKSNWGHVDYKYEFEDADEIMRILKKDRDGADHDYYYYDMNYQS
ncbi:unnamed protein product [Gordionus sp. m RMFG-2023]